MPIQLPKPPEPRKNPNDPVLPIEPPGVALKNSIQPYGLSEHMMYYRTSHNLLRTPRFAQPRALKTGDLLATGARVASEPRDGGNGLILVHLLLLGQLEAIWFSINPLWPIALLTLEDNVPAELWKMITG